MEVLKISDIKIGEYFQFIWNDSEGEFLLLGKMESIIENFYDDPKLSRAFKCTFYQVNDQKLYNSDYHVNEIGVLGKSHKGKVFMTDLTVIDEMQFRLITSGTDL